jgi:hypothetical protein
MELEGFYVGPYVHKSEKMCQIEIERFKIWKNQVQTQIRKSPKIYKMLKSRLEVLLKRRNCITLVQMW